MKLSRKCEYAFLVLIQLSSCYGNEELLSAAILSEQNQIPLKFLEQILGLLRKNGYVESVRGSSGGYHLAKPPAEINLAEIIRLIDGPIAPIASVSKFFYQKTPSEKNENLMSLFQEIRDYTAQRLENFTFQDLI